MNRQLKTLPQINIETDGSAIKDTALVSLTGVRVQQKLSLPTLCELTFLDADGLITPQDFSPGSELKIRIDGFDDALFNGQITAVEYLYEPSSLKKIRVRGYDKLHLLRKSQSVRAFVQMGLRDLISELTENLSIIIDMSENTPLRERIIQFEQTDFELMTEIAERNGLYFTLREDTLHVFTLEGSGDTTSLQLGENLLEARVEINADKLCRSVKTSGWNTRNVENFQTVIDAGRNGRNISAEIQTNDFGDNFEHFFTDENITDESEAAALSQAELDWRISQETVLRGVADGDTQLQPGKPVEIAGIADGFNGEYILTSVNHTIDSEKGFISEISTVLPKPHPRRKNSLATYGIVTAVNDPEKFGRVCVKLPNYNDVETDWMQVLSVGAGLGKGLLILPDIDDTVLVFFPRGDLTQGIILGGLYGMIQREDWDWGVEENAVKRFRLQTSGNQKISFDDIKQTLRMENSDGSFIEMSPEKVLLHASRDLEITAPGRAILIKSKTIDFEQMEDIEDADSD